MFDPDRIKMFERDGYLLGNQVIEPAEADALCREVTRVVDERDRDDVPQPVLCRNLGKSDDDFIWQIVDIWKASEPFARLLRLPKLVEAIHDLLGGAEIRVWHDQIQFKPASKGGVNMWHQDAPLWPILRPMNQVSAWIALDDADEGNGCMSMVPGSHRWGNCMPFLNGLKSFEEMPTSFEGHEVQVVPRPVPKGHVHFHHALTWHGSPANRSGRPRRAIAIHFMNEQTCYDATGDHPMKPFVTVEDGRTLTGKHFPKVYPLS